MAHTFTDSGLSALLCVFPRSAVIPAVMYAGLFASQTSGTVPDRTAHGGAAPGGWTETPQFASARQVISASQWSVPIISGNGVAVTGIQLTFPTATANGLSANGFFLSDLISSKAGDNPFFFANFDDLSMIAINSGDVVRITPRLQFNISALS